MARIALLGALTLAMWGAAAGVPGAANSGGRAVAASSAVATVARTAAENEAAARSEAASLLAALVLPPGATPSATEPGGDDGLLSTGAVSYRGAVTGNLATPNVVDDYAWWLLPGPPVEVLAYIRAHLPAGLMRSAEGRGFGPGEPYHESEAFQRPPITGILSERELSVDVVELADGSTALRADAVVVWITPRPPSEVIPAGATSLHIEVSGLAKNQPGQPRATITSRRQIEAVVALLNALPLAQPWAVYACPADFGIRVQLALYASRAAPPLAVADVDPEGCGGVALTIHGQAQPPLQSGYELIRQLDHALGYNVLPHGHAHARRRPRPRQHHRRRHRTRR